MSADLESQAAGHSCEAAANPSNSRPPSPSPRRQWPWSMNSSSVSIPDEHTATDNEFFATVVPNSLINLTVSVPKFGSKFVSVEVPGLLSFSSLFRDCG